MARPIGGSKHRFACFCTSCTHFRAKWSQKMPKGCPSGAQLAPNGAKRCQNGIHLAPIWRPQTLRSEYKKSIIISPGIIVFSVDIIHCSSNDHLAPICPPIGSQMAPRKQIGTHLATFLLPKVAVQMYRRHVNQHFYSRKIHFSVGPFVSLQDMRLW